MIRILIKCFMLVLLIGCLIGLFFYHPISTYEKVKIIEKYYASKPGEKLTGSKTKKKVSIPTKSNSETCAMEFENGKIFEMDCNTFLNFQIGEKVKIRYKDDHLIDIRRK